MLLFVCLRSPCVWSHPCYWNPLFAHHYIKAKSESMWICVSMYFIVLHYCCFETFSTSGKPLFYQHFLKNITNIYQISTGTCRRWRLYFPKLDPSLCFLHHQRNTRILHRTWLTCSTLSAETNSYRQARSYFKWYTDIWWEDVKIHLSIKLKRDHWTRATNLATPIYPLVVMLPWFIPYFEINR